MLRADTTICGTSTTGTGQLTLVAPPSPPGGMDFDVFARATGLGFGNSASVIVSYTIIEYTSSAFTTAKATEKGVGTLILGTSAGIGNSVKLSRTKIQTTATAMDTQPAVSSIAPGAGISIGTAANTLVFIGASAADVLAFQPFNDTANTLNGFPPLICGNATFNGGASVVPNQDWTWPFIWPYEMLAKRVYFRVESLYVGGTAHLYARLYQINSAGQAGKLLYDFGEVGTPGSAFNPAGGAFTMIASGALGNGFLLTPGEYMLSIFTTFSGGSGTPQLTQWANGSGPITSGFRGASNVQNQFVIYDNSGSSTPPDPAPAQAGQVAAAPCFFLAAS